MGNGRPVPQQGVFRKAGYICLWGAEPGLPAALLREKGMGVSAVCILPTCPGNLSLTGCPLSFGEPT